MARVLLIDDEPTICQSLAVAFGRRGHDVDIAATGEIALERALAKPPDVAVIDVSLPGMSGIDTFSHLRQQLPSLAGVFITAHGSIPSAVEAIRAGGWDYLTKPFDNNQLLLTIERALELQRLAIEIRGLRDEVAGRASFPGIIGASQAMQDLFRMLPRAAAADTTTLILGESGTGKELIARSLHKHGKRAAKPFLAVNSAAIAPALVESEFFGHERGAFTDAREARIGRFEEAHEGTLFLDEVGDLPLDSQAKLLRVLQNGEVTRVGGNRPITVDVHVIAATNKDLTEEMKRGRFRDDLFWRLHVITLRLPPLRERVGDIPLLAEYFIERLNLEMGSRIRGVSAEAIKLLMAHQWPGNVRELENVLRRAVIFADEDRITAKDITSHIAGPLADSASDEPWRDGERLADAVKRTTARVERAMIQAALAASHGRRQAAAGALGIDRKTLFLKMQAYGLATEITDDAAETPPVESHD
jgi:DNA-binding NtrC family response regulator